MSGKKSYSWMDEHWIDDPAEILQKMQADEKVKHDTWTWPRIVNLALRIIVVLLIIAIPNVIQTLLFYSGMSLGFISYIILYAPFLYLARLAFKRMNPYDSDNT